MSSFGSNLKQDDEGIWHSRNTQKVSYPSEGNQDCFAVEDNSFWFKHRNDCIVTLLREFPPRDSGPIFDIGGGNGFVSLAMAQAGFEVVLLEPGISGTRNAKRRGLKHVICATAETAGLKKNSVTAVGLFDVIEHIEDDRGFLELIREVLKPGGRLYITVPSYSFLWSEEDVIAGHYRRYTIRSISDLLKGTNFRVEYSSYIFRLLPPLIFLFRSLPFRIGLSNPEHAAVEAPNDHEVNNSLLSKLLEKSLKPEISKISKRNKMRFGGSCLIVASKE